MLSAPMAQLTRTFCHGERVDAILAEKRVDTLKELLAAVRRDVDTNMRHESNPPPETNVKATMLVHKRHMIGYSAYSF